MRKTVLALLLLSLTLMPILANGQRYFEVSSTEYRAVSWLCTYAGVSGPSNFGPVTQNQLENAIDRAEAVLGENNKHVLETRALFSEKDHLIGDSQSYFGVTASFIPELYVQSNPVSAIETEDGFVTFIDETWLSMKAKDRSAFLSCDFVFSVKDIAYGNIELDWQRDFRERGTFDVKLLTNWAQNQTENTPLRALVSIGNENLTFMTGRSGVSLGEGYSGNLAIGDNFDYQEFVKYGFFGQNIGVYLNLTSFESSHGETKTESPFGLVSPRFSGYKQLRHAAQFEVVAFDRLKFSFSLPNMIDTTSAFDIRLLSPFAVLHQYYNYKEYKILEGNNMLWFDLSFTPCPKLKLYIQYCMDQFQGKNEVSSEKGAHEPNAFSVLANITYTDFVKDGRLSVFLEGVYNAPGMYLNTKYYKDSSLTTITDSKPTGAFQYAWTQDFLVGYYQSSEDSCNDISYSGYIYGPDSITCTLGLVYERPETFLLEARLFYMAHGEKGRGSDLENYTYEGIDGKNYNKLTLTGTVEHTLALSLFSQYTFSEYLSISGGLNLAQRWNFRSQSGISYFNAQAYASLKLSYGI